jgi:hypothetical protein
MGWIPGFHSRGNLFATRAFKNSVRFHDPPRHCNTSGSQLAKNRVHTNNAGFVMLVKLHNTSTLVVGILFTFGCCFIRMRAVKGFGTNGRRALFVSPSGGISIRRALSARHPDQRLRKDYDQWDEDKQWVRLVREHVKIECNEGGKKDAKEIISRQAKTIVAGAHVFDLSDHSAERFIWRKITFIPTATLLIKSPVFDSYLLPPCPCARQYFLGI